MVVPEVVVARGSPGLGVVATSEAVSYSGCGRGRDEAIFCILIDAYEIRIFPFRM